MNNLDSFFAGLLLGEQGVSLPAKKVFNRNIALQDVVFSRYSSTFVCCIISTP